MLLCIYSFQSVQGKFLSPIFVFFCCADCEILYLFLVCASYGRGFAPGSRTIYNMVLNNSLVGTSEGLITEGSLLWFYAFCTRITHYSFVTVQTPFHVIIAAHSRRRAETSPAQGIS